ncbi:MAG: hypothetical protein WCG05_00125 [Alphaproteobacteria bacterium]
MIKLKLFLGSVLVLGMPFGAMQNAYGAAKQELSPESVEALAKVLKDFSKEKRIEILRYATGLCPDGQDFLPLVEEFSLLARTDMAANANKKWRLEERPGESAFLKEVFDEVKRQILDRFPDAPALSIEERIAMVRKVAKHILSQRE